MRNKGMVLLFLILIFGMTALDLFIEQKAFSESENRFLAGKPVFSKEALFSGKYTADYETYITDQFCFRDTWIRMKTLTERCLLRKDTNGVYFGKDGYLIEKQETNVFESDQSKKNIDVLAAFAEKMKEKMGKDHLRFLIVPTASEILTDKLPRFAAPYDQEKWIGNLEKLIGKDYVLNPCEELRNKKEEYLFYRTDHHWTSKGAYYAYRKYMESISLKPDEEKDFNVVLATDQFLGTLSSKVNLPLKPDTMYLYERKNPPKYRLVYDRTDDVRTSLYDRSALLDKDKYKVYLGGNYGLVEINTTRDTGRKLLVIKDSFAHTFVPFAVNHFDTVYMVDLRYFNMKIEDFMAEFPVSDVLVLYNTVNLAADQNVWKLKP